MIVLPKLLKINPPKLLFHKQSSSLLLRNSNSILQNSSSKRNLTTNNYFKISKPLSYSLKNVQILASTKTKFSKRNLVSSIDHQHNNFQRIFLRVINHDGSATIKGDMDRLSFANDLGLHLADIRFRSSNSLYWFWGV